MRRYHGNALSWIDMLFNMLAVFACLFILTVVLIADPTHNTKAIDTKAKILITMTWAGDSADDMDVWLLTPEPAKIGYNNTGAGGIASLDRDDLGITNNVYTGKDGKQHYLHDNHEVISIRQKLEGHYAVDVMFFARQMSPETGKTSVGPQEVTVTITEIDPSYREVITKSVTLSEERDIKNAVSFDIVAGGAIVNVDTSGTDGDFIHRNIGGQP